jgi:hypothetical protein
MSAYARERAHDRIAALAGQGLDLVSFWREATEVLDPVVPHFGGPCWYTLDPASLLITSHYNPEMPVLPPNHLALEYYADDVNQLAHVARTPSGASTLHEATGGDPTSSPRWQANIALGGDQELIVALRTAAGDAWGRPRALPRAGSPELRSRRDRLRPRERRRARGGGPAGAAARRGDGPGRPGGARTARPLL